MNKILKINHNAGFFSCCTIRLVEIIKFYNKNKILPIVDSSSQWENYKDENEDVTNIFFKENNINDLDLLDVSITNNNDEEQFSNYSEINFNNIKFFIDKYFSISNIVNRKIYELLETYNINLNESIGVLFRGNDKTKETNIPSYDEILNKIKEIKEKYPNKKLIIQSDEKEFYNFILTYYPDAIYFEEVVSINKNIFSAVQYNIEHGNKIKQAILFLSILILLSKTNILILNSGNVGLWCCLYRGSTNNVHQYLNQKEYIYGVKNNSFKKVDNYWYNEN